MSVLTHWLWPILSAFLAALWLWTLLRQRGRQQPGEASLLCHERVEAEDVLKAAYSLQEEQGWLNADDLARAADLPRSVTRQGLEALVALEWAEQDAEGGVRLTDEGVARAQDLIRAHRLWERYLVDREGMSLDAVHEEAHRREHTTTSEELERLDAELGYPAWDPHGHAIPAPESRVPSSGGRSLWEEADPGDQLRVISVDDDSPPLLAQLVALGLRPGVDVKVVERDSDLLQLEVDGDLIPVASAAAKHVSVVTAPGLPLELGRLPVGARARVVEIKGSGKYQRRLLDMGFVPGAEVTVIRRASLGDPIEYRIKGTGVAMRHTDANSVMVEEVGNG